jgi:monofunctional biosynthetic peptidoglycan transglycosylase
MKKLIGKILLAALTVFMVFALYIVFTFPDVRELESHNPESTPFIEWKQRWLEAAGKKSRVEHDFVPYSEISSHLKTAVLKSEDQLLFEHQGFDFYEIKIAVRNWWMKKKGLRGASTISMQTARLIYLTPERSYLRKFREALITIALERYLTKKRIFELYLNYSDWGDGLIGAEAASRRYFKKSCRRLSCDQAVALAAMLPAPDIRNPTKPSPAMQRHTKRLMRQMPCGRPSAAQDGEQPLVIGQ